MLSHHELATLLLLRDAGCPMEMLDSDFAALRHYQLVEVDERAGDDAALRLTNRGRALLARLIDPRGS
jgi:hypothetical protein